MRWGLIGASTIASQYMIDAIRAQADNQIAWVYSTTAERAAEFATSHQIAQSFDDLDLALSDNAVEAVYISSTNEKHLSQAMMAIEAGKHVICEKPLAMEVKDAADMVRAADEAGVVFATNHHLRCSGSHQAIKEIITSGQIGTVLSLRIFHAVHLPVHLQGWRINDAAAGGGVIPDITVHDADVTRFLLDEDPIEVVAQMAASGMGEGVEDSAMSVWRMPSGAMVMTHESFTHPFAGSGLEVHGTKGSIFASGVMTQQPVGTISLVHEAGQQDVSFSDHNLYIYGVGRFVDAVAGKGTPAATGPDGVKSLAVALAVRAAAATGQQQRVHYEGL